MPETGVSTNACRRTCVYTRVYVCADAYSDQSRHLDSDPGVGRPREVSRVSTWGGAASSGPRGHTIPVPHVRTTVCEKGRLYEVYTETVQTSEGQPRTSRYLCPPLCLHGKRVGTRSNLTPQARTKTGKPLNSEPPEGDLKGTPHGSPDGTQPDQTLPLSTEPTTDDSDSGPTRPLAPLPSWTGPTPISP